MVGAAVAASGQFALNPPPMHSPTPPATVPDQFQHALRSAGYALLLPQHLQPGLYVEPAGLSLLTASWSDLPPDAYLRDGGRYRRRRHSCFIAEGGILQPVPHRPHWQPVEYNALHGGLQRLFEPMADSVLSQPVWPRLLLALAATCSSLRGEQRWYIESHQFRIDTTDGIGRPTPEGAHRDGVDFVVVALVERSGVKGGETRVFDAAGPQGIRFTMTEPWTLLMLDDARMIHETTPIQPLQGDTAAIGHRDTLVLTFRRNRFQGPA